MDYWKGPKIRLRAVEPGDAEVFFAWNRDAEMNRNLDFLWPPGSLERQRRWAEKTATQEVSDDGYFWVIEAPDGQVAGCINTHHCDRRTGTFSYGVAVRREYQRRGYAAEAIVMVLRYFFEELRYQKVTVDVHSDNPASIRLHERLGFQAEGRIRRAVFNEGRYGDDLLFGMLVEEYQALYGR
jgi:RimJ/RimL family protein N-acetyltransferase